MLDTSAADLVTTFVPLTAIRNRPDLTPALSAGEFVQTIPVRNGSSGLFLSFIHMPVAPTSSALDANPMLNNVKTRTSVFIKRDAAQHYYSAA